MKTIVLIQTAFLGDLILNISLMKELKIQYPDHKLILVCRIGLGILFKDLGLVDDVVEIQKGKSESYVRALHQLNKNKIDILISAHNSWRTSFFVKKIKADLKVGYTTNFSMFFYDKTIQRDESLPESIRALQLLCPLKIKFENLIHKYKYNTNPYDLDPQKKLPAPPDWANINLTDKINQKSSFLKIKNYLGLNSDKPMISIFPGSVWETKKWTESGFIQLAEKLQKDGYQIAFLGGESEFQLCSSIQEKVKGDSINLAGKLSLVEVLAFLSGSKAVIANDSAGAHMAAVANAPTVTIFGPTIPEFGYRPWATNSYIAQIEDLFCKPCGSHGHKKCPIGTHECMKTLSSTTVYEIVKNALKN